MRHDLDNAAFGLLACNLPVLERCFLPTLPLKQSPRRSYSPGCQPRVRLIERTNKTAGPGLKQSTVSVMVNSNQASIDMYTPLWSSLPHCEP
jgi:hypothetical protein